MTEIETIINDIQSIDQDIICVAIDGYCGSGKTTFAEKLKEQLDANLVHIDDFYLPFKERKENWMEILAGNMNFPRLEKEVLSNLKKESLTYTIFNHRQPNAKNQVTLQKKKIFILEGAYCHHPDIRSYFNYFIFFKCSDEKQKERLISREGDHFEDFKNVWIKREREYFDGYHIMENANIIVDTSNWF